MKKNLKRKLCLRTIYKKLRKRTFFYSFSNEIHITNDNWLKNLKGILCQRNQTLKS
jgi:hypothetical protein